MTDVLKTFTAVSAWTSSFLPKLEYNPVDGESPTMRDAFLQELLNRAEFLKDAIGGTDTFRVTSIGEMQVKGTNKTGGASVVGWLLCPYLDAEISGTTNATAATITGTNSSNTTAGRLYMSIAEVAGNATVLVYSDATMLAQVAHGALVGNAGGAAALTADGGSGIGGTITLAAGVPAVADVAGYIDMGEVSGFAKAGIDATNVVAICGEAVAANAEMWITIPGGYAQVLIEATGNVAFGQYMRSGSTTAGRAQADDEMAQDKLGQYIGRSIGRKEAGVGTTCGILFNPSLSIPGVQRTRVTMASTEFAALGAGVKTFDKALKTLPTNGRVLGCIIGEGTFTLFDDAAHGTYGLEIGIAADHDYLCMSTDVAAATGTTDPKTGMGGLAGLAYRNLGGTALRLYMTSSVDLNTATAGSVNVDIYYQVIA